jgi:hypothetical protein
MSEVWEEALLSATGYADGDPEKADVVHTHAQADVTGLEAAIAAKAAVGSTFPYALSVAASQVGSPGVSAEAARADHIHPIVEHGPADHGLQGWNFPNYCCAASQTLSAAGTMFVCKIPLPTNRLISNAILSVGSVGVSLTAGECFAAVYHANGTLLSATADQAAAWVSNGVKVMPLTSPGFVLAGYCYLGWWYNGTTSPGFSRAGSAPSGFANVGLSSSATYLYGTANTGLTTTAPATLGTISSSNNMIWAALS